MEEEFQPKKKRKLWIFITALFLIGLFSLFFLKTGFTISKVIGQRDIPNQNLPLAEDLPDLPEKDNNRLNILLLGIRGPDDPGEGKLLSDAIILFSVRKSDSRVALISLPRDLYARLWCLEEKKKINFAYAQGGLECAKKTISYITDLYIDYAVAVDFEALKKTVDVLGGISIYLNTPFEENFQWSKEGWEESENWFIKEIDGEERWVFHLSQGENYLDGQTALYYVRSRYSTDDFDRMSRQQQVLIALKEKALSLGMLTNPVKIYNFLDILGKHFRTDASLGEIKNLVSLTLKLDIDNIQTRIFDISPGGLLYYTFINKEYVLLPIEDNFEKIQDACKNIFDL
ncbi:MAG: hypothetical protein AVO34_02180 [Firmicutes bacterium ML8_F2]|jgi:polyisoprenyl-teichoic acid--peptidoglycan teichoic acid transferase|nr:MAG: hypothetical protein AVO34_02180 [Firmicutes bacterium ML8_F2]